MGWHPLPTPTPVDTSPSIFTTTIGFPDGYGIIGDGQITGPLNVRVPTGFCKVDMWLRVIGDAAGSEILDYSLSWPEPAIAVDYPPSGIHGIGTLDLMVSGTGVTNFDTEFSQVLDFSVDTTDPAALVNAYITFVVTPLQVP